MFESEKVYKIKENLITGKMKNRVIIPFSEIKQIMKKSKDLCHEEKVNLFFFFILMKSECNINEIRRQMKISKNKKDEYLLIVKDLSKEKKSKNNLYFSKKELLYLLNKKVYKRCLYFIITVKINLIFNNNFSISRKRLIQHFFNYNINNKNSTRKAINWLNELVSHKIIGSYTKDKNKFYFYKNIKK